ncbi:MAG: leucine-rich repeat domain-containing protein [Clostridia bacterium]|nr:leucine-rich repeat domain-containing protein [Clostridia bacterium]
MRFLRVLSVILSCILLFCLIPFESFLENSDTTSQDQKPEGDFCIPEGITHVATYAYANSEKMTSLTIPDFVTHIDMWAFQSCTSLKTIYFPKRLPSTNLSGGWAGSGFWSPYTFSDVFRGCSSLETLVASSEAEGYRVENNCLITDEGKLLFATKNAVIPDDGSIKNIGADAFANLTTIKNITIPNGVEIIEARAFAGTGIEQLILPESVKSINESAFFNCKDLQEVVFGRNIETVEISHERGYLKGFYLKESVPNLTIKCYKGTVAYQYAIDNYVPVVLLNDVTEEETTERSPETQGELPAETTVETEDTTVMATEKPVTAVPETVYEESEMTQSDPHFDIESVTEKTEDITSETTSPIAIQTEKQEVPTAVNQTQKTFTGSAAETLVTSSEETTGASSDFPEVVSQVNGAKMDLVTLLAVALGGVFVVVALSIMIPLVIRHCFKKEKN